MATIDGWKKLISIVNSPSNGITFDCGVTREMGGDPVETCRYFGSRDRINHVHFRNVLVQKPYVRYTEVFLDEGENDMTVDKSATERVRQLLTTCGKAAPEVRMPAMNPSASIID